MDGLTLLAEACAAGLTVRAEGDRLVIRGPKRAEPLARKLVEYKARVLAVLAGQPEPGTRVSGTGTAASPATEALAEVSKEVPANRSGRVADALPLLRIPLNCFAQEGCFLEVKVPWLPVTLWFVPGAADAQNLVHEGISRGRIWTAGELMDLLTTPGVGKEQTQTIARVKLEFDGVVVEVLRRRKEYGRDQ